MKFKEKYNINKDFESLFTFQDEKEELDHEAHMIMLRFLGEIEENYSKNDTFKKNELAIKLGVSPSYITQLFKGDKLMNLTMLAKIQKAFNITFEIKARNNESLYAVESLNINSMPSYLLGTDGFWVWRNFKNPDYTSTNDSCEKSIKRNKKPSESAA